MNALTPRLDVVSSIRKMSGRDKSADRIVEPVMPAMCTRESPALSCWIALVMILSVRMLRLPTLNFNYTMFLCHKMLVQVHGAYPFLLYVF